MPENTDKKPTCWRVIRIISIVLFAVSVAAILSYRLPQWLTPTTVIPSLSTPSDTQEENLPTNPIDFPTLQAEKPEAVGWIKIGGTVIDYPIMQSNQGSPENYYLDHRPDGSAHREGSIYIQQLNNSDFTDPNTVLYGHNMATGRMFAAIRRYQNKNFFDQNRYITIYIPGHVLTYEVYSAFVYDNRHILNSFDFSDENAYSLFLQQTLNPTSMTKQVREGISVTTNARIITLSTCTGRSSERFLVVGVLTNDQKTR